MIFIKLMHPKLSHQGQHTHSHDEGHFRSSIFLRDVVIGMADGLTVPFALAAGLSGAVSSNAIILTAGLAEIVAGSISMGLGGYLAGKTETEVYQGELKREYQEVDEIPEEEKQEVRIALARYGLSHNTKELVVHELTKDKHQWVDFMMRFELGLEEPKSGQATRSALSIGGAYAAGGIVPLIPYWLTEHPHTGLFYSSITTLCALAVFGFVKSKFTGQPPFGGALRVVITGALAAAVAYAVASYVQFS
jgi:VIT1/CCC1 family predicted Fe2+/Mn2+ transporter